MKLPNGCIAEDSEFYSILTEILQELREEEIEFQKHLNEARRHQSRLTLQVAFKMLDRGETDG